MAKDNKENNEVKELLDGIKKELKGYITQEFSNQIGDYKRKYADKINKETPKVKGDEKVGFGKIISTLAKSKGDSYRARDIAKSMGDEVLKGAMNEESFTAGGAFVVNEFRGGEMIDYLRNASVVRQANPRIISLGTSGVVTIPKVTNGTSAYFLGELDNAETTEMETGTLTLAAKKMMAVVPVSNELLKDSSVNMEQQIMADLAAAFATKEDTTMLRGTGEKNSFKGLRHLANANNILDVTDASSPSAADTIKDLYRMLTRMKENNIPGARLHFFFAPRTEAYLKQLRDSSGGFLFANEMNTSGTILGVTYSVSNNMPNNLGDATNETEIILADMNEVILATKDEIEVTVVPYGAYYDGSSVVSGISQDSTVIVAHERLDFNVRRDLAVVVMTGATNW